MDIEKLYRTYGPMVLRRCRQLLYDEHMALDALQEVFVSLMQNQSRMNDAYPSSLLYTMATNHCLNVIRSYKKQHTPQESQTILEQIAQYDEGHRTFELNKILLTIFRQEPVSTRLIATLHFVDGFTLAQTAKQVSMSVSGVRKRLAQLQKRLQIIKGHSNEQEQ
ncbi:MAG: sigma-70 family RNA polymerase sigma factor [Chitinivibrionales bacterium]|nr:sigma-70 family RNA polymerase sigma factor [Chitinivibrionales bacterium]